MLYNKTFCFSTRNGIEKVKAASLEKTNITHLTCVGKFPCVLSVEKNYRNITSLDCKKIITTNITQTCSSKNYFLPVYDGKQTYELKSSEMLDFCKIIHNNFSIYTPKKIIRHLKNITLRKSTGAVYVNVTKKIPVHNYIPANDLNPINVTKNEHVLNRTCVDNLRNCLKNINNTEYLNKINFIAQTINKTNFEECLITVYNNLRFYNNIITNIMLALNPR